MYIFSWSHPLSTTWNRYFLHMQKSVFCLRLASVEKGFFWAFNVQIQSHIILAQKDSLHSLPRTPGQLFQRLEDFEDRIWRHPSKLTWEEERGCVWQVSEASRPPTSRISFSFGWWTVSNSMSFGSSGDTDASFCRHAKHRYNAMILFSFFEAFLLTTLKLDLCSLCFKLRNT